jgi:hypothetical protein
MTAMTAADALVALVRANQDVSNHGPGCTQRWCERPKGSSGFAFRPHIGDWWRSLGHGI